MKILCKNSDGSTVKRVNLLLQKDLDFSRTLASYEFNVLLHRAPVRSTSVFVDGFVDVVRMGNVFQNGTGVVHINDVYSLQAMYTQKTKFYLV